MKDWLPRGIVKPRHVVRPVASGFSGGANRFLLADGWNVIDQANPSVASLDPDQVEAYSDAIGCIEAAGHVTSTAAYEGAANSKKTLIDLRGNQGTAGEWLIPFSEFISGTIVDQLTAEGNFTFAGNPQWAHIDFGMNFRVRSITADYAIDLATWTSFNSSPPSMSTIYEHGFQWEIAPVVGDSTHVLATDFASYAPAIHISGALPYGLVLDCKAQLDYQLSSGGFLGLTSGFAQLFADVPNGTETNIPLIPMP